MRIHTSTELREIDQHAASALLVPTQLLMENAGRAVAEAARSEAARRRGRIFVVCGKGNNGGDGYVAARHLAAAGFDVRLLAMASPDEMAGDAAVNARAAVACGIPFNGSLNDVGRDDVIVDAIFGTGLSRAPEGRARELIDAINAGRARGSFVVAVDLPSGLNADLPVPPGEAVRADVTVALHSLKPALTQYPSRSLCGEVRVESLGISKAFAPGPVRTWLTREDVARRLPGRPTDAHKGTNGHLLIIAGSPGKSGAAQMACIGALRAGAGLVTLAAPAEVINRVLPMIPEAMGFPLEALSSDGLNAAMQGKDAIAIGPGLQRFPTTGPMLGELIEHLKVPVLIDADGLNALAASAHALAQLAKAQVTPVLTPHPAELARLLGKETAEVQRDRFAAATEAAVRFRSQVLLKGACSVIAHPDGSLEVNSTGNPAMATGGMGDVLTGIGGALLAQHLTPADALVVATWVHGRAGDLARVGARGLLALDLAGRVPEALAELE
jgi:NAD(P)H-hydrate epimerase